MVLKNLSQDDFLRVAKAVRVCRKQGVSNRGLLIKLQITEEELAFIDKFNARIDQQVADNQIAA